MNRKLAALICILAACAMQPLYAQRQRPDLTVRQYQFAPTNDKVLRVSVANIGGGAAASSVVRLTVRKIKGTAVGRTMEMEIPAVPGGQAEWILLDASGILPKDVALKDTTFKINLDVTSKVAESNENNNEKWHNL